MLWKAIVVVLVLATQVHAGVDAVVEKQSTKTAKTTETRATTTGAAVGTSEILKTDSKINMTEWDHDATFACHAALTKLPRSSNPSGRCICYNLPMLNNSTGKFEADLRLYQLSVPWGDFQGIAPEDVHVSFKFNGASVSPVSAASAASLVVRDDSSSKNATLQLLHQYLFSGQIKAEMMSTGMTM